jgi:hypothetical protein
MLVNLLNKYKYHKYKEALIDVSKDVGLEKKTEKVK